MELTFERLWRVYEAVHSALKEGELELELAWTHSDDYEDAREDVCKKSEAEETAKREYLSSGEFRFVRDAVCVSTTRTVHMYLEMGNTEAFEQQIVANALVTLFNCGRQKVRELLAPEIGKHISYSDINVTVVIDLERSSDYSENTTYTLVITITAASDR